LTPKYTDQNLFLDAVNGDWRKRDTGVITTLEKAVVTDIEGHWPDQAITRGEMIKMLVIAMNGGSDSVENIAIALALSRMLARILLTSHILNQP
jgi:hypothetical protein